MDALLPLGKQQCWGCWLHAASGWQVSVECAPAFAARLPVVNTCSLRPAGMAFFVSVANSELNPLKREPSGQAHHRWVPRFRQRPVCCLWMGVHRCMGSQPHSPGRHTDVLLVDGRASASVTFIVLLLVQVLR